MEENVCPRCGSENAAVVSRGLPDSDVSPQGDYGTSTEHHESSTKRIRFYLGDYSDGYHDLTLVKREQGASIHYNPPYTAEGKSPIDRRINDDEWATLMRDIYRCHIMDWNTQYIDPCVCDGTLWELKITFKDKSIVRRQGSNAYPPHLEDLLGVFMHHGLLGDEAVSL